MHQTPNILVHSHTAEKTQQQLYLSMKLVDISSLSDRQPQIFTGLHRSALPSTVSHDAAMWNRYLHTNTHIGQMLTTLIYCIEWEVCVCLNYQYKKFSVKWTQPDNVAYLYSIWSYTLCTKLLWCECQSAGGELRWMGRYSHPFTLSLALYVCKGQWF